MLFSNTAFQKVRLGSVIIIIISIITGKTILSVLSVSELYHTNFFYRAGPVSLASDPQSGGPGLCIYVPQ
jgi:hypothetical protein